MSMIKGFVAALSLLLVSLPAYGATGTVLTAGAGLGFDSNAHRAPNDTYTDFAQAGNPTIVPDTKTAIFAPLSFGAKYSAPVEGGKGGTEKVFSYTLDADVYFGSNTRDATQHIHRLKGGIENIYGDRYRNRGKFYVGPFFKYRNKTYVDRDTGLPAVSSGSGTDISARFTYKVYGLELDYSRNFHPYEVDMSGKTALFDYDDPGVVSQYDKTAYEVGAGLSYRLERGTKARIGVKYDVSTFKERSPHELDGSLNATGEKTKYKVLVIEAGIKKALSDTVLFYLDYTASNRTDDYVGYYDYNKGDITAKLVFDNKKDLRIKARVKSWKREYDNALAFDTPGQKKLDYKYLKVGIDSEYNVDEKLSLWVDFEHLKQDTTDLRYKYNRNQVMVGLEYII